MPVGVKTRGASRDVRRESKGIPFNLLEGIAHIVIYGVKRLNPYLCARPCFRRLYVEYVQYKAGGGEPHEVSGNTHPRYMIIRNLRIPTEFGLCVQETLFGEFFVL